MRLVSHLYQRLMVKLQRGDAYMPGKLFSAAFDRLVSWLNQENSSCFSVNQKTKDINMTDDTTFTGKYIKTSL